MKVEPGRFYLSRIGQVWCCFRATKCCGACADRDCVAVTGADRSRVDFFYSNGRFIADSTEHEHTLVSECDANGKPMVTLDFSEEAVAKMNQSMQADTEKQVAARRALEAVLADIDKPQDDGDRMSPVYKLNLISEKTIALVRAALGGPST